jgi:hypothetical protein
MNSFMRPIPYTGLKRAHASHAPGHRHDRAVEAVTRGNGFRPCLQSTVGLPRFVVEELAAHLADPSDPEAFVFTAPEGGTLRLHGFRARVWRPAVTAAGLDGLRIHDLRHTAVALWIAAGANPKEVSTRAGHASVSFTLDRYGHLYPEADTALRDRLDALYGSAQPAPTSPVVRLPRRAGRGPSVAPGASGNDESAADDATTTL